MPIYLNLNFKKGIIYIRLKGFFNYSKYILSYAYYYGKRSMIHAASGHEKP